MSTKNEFDAERGLIFDYGTKDVALNENEHVVGTDIPAVSTTSRSGYLLLTAWMLLNILVQVTNQHLLSDTIFPYPATLSSFHWVTTGVVLAAVRLALGWIGGSEHDQDLTPKVDGIMIGSFAVIAAVYDLAVTTALRDHVAISLIQMVLLPASCCAMLVIYLFGLQALQSVTMVGSCIVAIGGAVMLGGENHLYWSAALWMAPVVLTSIILPVMVEKVRPVLVAKPMRVLCTSVPVAALFTTLMAITLEGTSPLAQMNHSQLVTILGNSLIVTVYNWTSVLLWRTSGPSRLIKGAMTKALILVAYSYQVDKSLLSNLQLCGLSVSTIGALILMSSEWDRMSSLKRRITNAFLPGLDGGESTSPSRFPVKRSLLMLLCGSALCAFVSYLSTSHSTSLPYQYLPEQVNRYRHWAPNSELAPGDNRYGMYTVGGKGIDIIPAYDPNTNFKSLPRLAWVIVATTDAVAQYRNELMAISCWASRHGIPFYLETHLLVSDRNFMTARHASIAKHLRNYQWIMSTDADFIPMDSTASLTSWLDDKVDLILQDRPPEICACFYMLKNSPGGWSFLQRFMGWADKGARCNWDNGDLQEMIGAALQPGPPNSPDYTTRFTPGVDWIDFDESKSKHEHCYNDVTYDDWDEYGVFLNCSNRQMAPLRSHREQSYGILDLWAFTDVLPSTRMKFHYKLGGPVRFIEGQSIGNGLEGLGMPGDVMGTGKGLGVYLPEAAILCDGRDWLMEPRLNATESRQLIGSEFPWAPFCHDSDGRNLCVTSGKP